MRRQRFSVLVDPAFALRVIDHRGNTFDVVEVPMRLVLVEDRRDPPVATGFGSAKSVVKVGPARNVVLGQP
ncbi:hypothetical protein [Rhodococcus sp. IEGM 1318]|uniref:hypothetical protein n=1 Tax=Rhodococcus sp. IEGM 1318 TaxID=3082226 RepID=UPI002955CBC9|nr:hypothetical protein [Rhodococcus sp. IEGM 1318]MDV8008473.1 hypothetical protein [Rhodococcus sp. IEGM 1318]